MPSETVIEVERANPPEIGACRHPDCGRSVEWVTTRAKRKRMPIDAPLLVLSATQLLDGREIVTVASSQSHFATCPFASSFRKGGR